jgi:hypothetical protein
LHYVLLSDGPSDRVLLPILDWLLQQHGVTSNLSRDWADPGQFRRTNGGNSPTTRIRDVLKVYRCDLLFVHRDAEKQEASLRYDEIKHAVLGIASEVKVPPYICVVPIRMTEAWLLFDEQAIRSASGNPNGRMPLDLPNKNRVEALPDPKEILYSLLKEASGLPTHRRRSFRPSANAIRVTDFIDDFSPLRGLMAFDALEQDIAEFLNR